MSRVPLHPPLRTPLIALAVAAYLTGCASVTDKPGDKTGDKNFQRPTQTASGEDKPVTPPYKGGGYYKDDGPGRDIPANLGQVPDAVPKAEPLHPYANDPYKVLGKRYTPISPEQQYKAKGLASWYGRKFHGKNTSSGEPYDMYAMTAAHATLPIPSYARVTNLENGQSAIVRINDRGPFHAGRIIDLSYTAAYKLDVLKGVTPVEVELVSADAAPDSFIARADAPIIEAPEPEAPVRETEPATQVGKPVGKPSYLQLGAFSKHEGAEALFERAKTQLSREFPGVMRLEIGSLHKVQAGPFMSDEAVARADALIRKELGITPIKIVAIPAPATKEATASEAPVKQADLPVKPTTPTHGLYLQLAALSKPDAADALTAKVKTRYGADLPGITQVNVDKLFKVQAGPFANPAAAEKVALAYQRDFGAKPYKVQY